MSIKIIKRNITENIDKTKIYSSNDVRRCKTPSTRFGKVVFTTDSDLDGSHINGLLINLFERFWPEMFHNNMVYTFRTPLIKVFLKNKKVIEFFDEKEFLKWEETTTEKNFTKKYYKGLGTSSTEEFKHYLSNLQEYMIRLDLLDKKDSDAIDMSFNKKRADERKEWLSTPAEDVNNFISNKSIKIEHFINTSVKSYSLHNNVRSIPSMIDGFKESQKKAVYGMMLRENINEMPVERLAASISSDTDYHHGTTSMENTIINMANNYTGSNNLNLFIPSGQYGSRLSPESASARYVMTKFSPNFRTMFKKDDDGILEHKQSSTGDVIEPNVFYPLLPLVLLNGASGTGTGHACNIKNYNPNDIKKYIIKVLNGSKIEKNSLVPFYKGFKGKIEKNKETKQIFYYGSFQRINTTTLVINELPIGVYLNDYKQILNTLEDEGIIKSYDDKSTDTEFEFVIKAPRTTLELTDDEIMKKFKLIVKDTENLTLWNENNTLEKFDCVEDVIQRFVALRLSIYAKRKQYLINKLQKSLFENKEKLRFILFYLKNISLFKSKSKDELIKLMIDNKFEDPEKLLSISLWNLTMEKVEELKKTIDKNTLEITELESVSPKDMYIQELKNFKYEE